jgi:hypothetical protein
MPKHIALFNSKKIVVSTVSYITTSLKAQDGRPNFKLLMPARQITSSNELATFSTGN